MKNLLLIFTLTSVSLSQIVFSTSFDLASQYNWRGYVLTEEAVVQPSLDISFGESPFSFNVWGSFAFADRDVSKYADELDFTLNYSTSMGKTGLDLGAIYYSILNADEFNTVELYVSASLDMNFSPTVSVYYDIALFNDFYAHLGFEEELSDTFTADLGFGYVNSESDLSDIHLGISTSFAANKPSIT